MRTSCIQTLIPWSSLGVGRRAILFISDLVAWNQGFSQNHWVLRCSLRSALKFAEGIMQVGHMAHRTRQKNWSCRFVLICSVMAALFTSAAVHEVLPFSSPQKKDVRPGQRMGTPGVHNLGLLRRHRRAFMHRIPDSHLSLRGKAHTRTFFYLISSSVVPQPLLLFLRCLLCMLQHLGSLHSICASKPESTHNSDLFLPFLIRLLCFEARINRQVGSLHTNSISTSNQEILSHRSVGPFE